VLHFQDFVYLPLHIYILITVQCSNLLLVLASTVILVLRPRRNSWPNFCSFQDHLCVWKWGLLSAIKRFVVTFKHSVRTSQKTPMAMAVTPSTAIKH
jgi:hypothetical protein